jgi:hypothetical protein
VTIPVDVSVLFFVTDGVSTTFNLTGEDGPLYFYQPSDLIAAHITADGVTLTRLHYNTDFAIGGSGRDGTGQLTTQAVDALPAGTLTVWRNTDVVQPERYLENDSFPSATHNNAQDRGRLIDQDIARRVALCFNAPNYETAPPPVPRIALRKGRFAVFDASNGDMVASDFTVADLLNWITQLQNGEGGGGGATPGLHPRKITVLDPSVTITLADHLDTIFIDMSDMVANRDIVFNPVTCSGVDVLIRRKSTKANPYTITVNGSLDMQLGNEGWMRLKSDGTTIDVSERG